MQFKNVDYWNMKGMICIVQIPYFPVIQKIDKIQATKVVKEWSMQ